MWGGSPLHSSGNLWPVIRWVAGRYRCDYVCSGTCHPPIPTASYFCGCFIFCFFFPFFFLFSFLASKSFYSHVPLWPRVWQTTLQDPRQLHKNDDFYFSRKETHPPIIHQIMLGVATLTYSRGGKIIIIIIIKKRLSNLSPRLVKTMHNRFLWSQVWRKC